MFKIKVVILVLGVLLSAVYSANIRQLNIDEYQFYDPYYFWLQNYQQFYPKSQNIYPHFNVHPQPVPISNFHDHKQNLHKSTTLPPIPVHIYQGESPVLPQYDSNMISSNNNDENKLGTLNVDSVTKKKIIQNLFHKFTKRTTTSPSTTKDPNRVIQECLEDCIMRPPSHYNPVCGTDQQTYQNEGRLICYQDCGVDVRVDRLGSCTPMAK